MKGKLLISKAFLTGRPVDKVVDQMSIEREDRLVL